MNLNLLVIPSLLLALLFFWTGRVLFDRCSTAARKVVLSIASFILGIPGFLMPLYYLHLFDDARWFYEFRSLPFTELSAAGAGLFAGVFAGLVKATRVRSRVFLIAVLCLGIIAPHLKPVIAPLPGGRLEDTWADGVCLQSTASSCGPASAATILRSFGIDATERQIARESFTYLGGTENWYLARTFARRGIDVTFQILPVPPRTIPTPSIAGVDLSGIGHFIPVLAETTGTYVTADPLIGRREHPKDKIFDSYEFTGFFMVFSKSD